MTDFTSTRRSLIAGAAGFAVAAAMPRLAFAMPAVAEISHDPALPALANADGDVTIVEVVDYQCGYCKLCYLEIVKLVEEDPGIRLVFKDWPVFGPASEFAARAVLSLNDDARTYHAAIDALMRNDGRLSEKRVLRLLEGAGVDASKLQAGMDARKPEIDAILARNAAHAQEFGLRGTPAVLVGSKLFRRAMPVEDLRNAVAEARREPADSDT